MVPHLPSQAAVSSTVQAGASASQVFVSALQLSVSPQVSPQSTSTSASQLSLTVMVPHLPSQTAVSSTVQVGLEGSPEGLVSSSLQAARASARADINIHRFMSGSFLSLWLGKSGALLGTACSKVNTAKRKK